MYKMKYNILKKILYLFINNIGNYNILIITLIEYN